MTNSAIDTAFRPALDRMIRAGRVMTCEAEVSPDLEIGAIMKRRDGAEAILFPRVTGYDTPVIGNVLGSAGNCEAAFASSAAELRDRIDAGLGTPLAPELVTDAPVQTVVTRSGIDILATIPALKHAPDDAGRYITAGIVIGRDPETGVYNSSYHRMQVIGPDRVAIKIDYGRHLRAAFERAQRAGHGLPVAVCLGADVALHLAAATMGSQMPESADEMAVAGGIAGRPMKIARAVSQDMVVPAEAEYILEGVIEAEETYVEGPFGEFVGYAAAVAPTPVLRVTALTRREKPVYHAINGFGRETVMLRKYVLEASLLKVLRPAVPIVKDVEMTAGGLHRFHAVIQVAKTSDAHDGWPRNAALAAFGTLKDLDLVTLVDDDIDLRDPADVEYALATRMEASRDVIMVPGVRGHEYVRVSDRGIRTKLILDATVPFGDRARFARVAFADVSLPTDAFQPATAETLRFLRG